MSDTPRQRFGALLRTLRTEHHLTQAAIGRHVHASPDAVATWEKGRSLPDEATVRRLDALLNADGTLHRAWLEADTRTDNPTAPDPALSAASLLASSAHDAAEFGTWAEITNAGAVAITTLTHRTRALADLALTAPPGQIIAEAAGINHTLFDLLRGHNRPGHARDLYTAAGATCALLAWLSGDLGNLEAARIHGATAQTCAEMAENPELAAWAAVVRSKTAFWAKDYLTAVNLASEGARHAAPGTASVMLACQQADAWAKLGAGLETARAAERHGGIDSLGGLFTCKTGRAMNYAAASYGEIAHHRQALDAADAAFEAFEREGGYGFGTIAQTHLSRMLAHAGAGDLDAAAVAARPVLDLPEERRLATLRARFAPFAAALASPSLRTSTVAAPLREEITEFCIGGGQRALPAGDERRGA